MNDYLTYIVYYEGAYGDTIRIATKQKTWLVKLKERLLRILSGESDDIDICNLGDIKIFDSINELVLTKTNKRSKSCVAFEMVNGSRSYKWKLDNEEIETIIGLIDGLICDESPGHQYLTDEEEGCLIELSYNED